MVSMGSNADARALEEAFFGQQNARLLEKLRAKAERRARHEALREVVRIEDDAFLDRLIDLGIRPETVLALRLVPLAFVAWADGRIDAAERDAILRAAEEKELPAGSPAHTLLSTWLSHAPEPHLLDLWKGYVRSIWSAFTVEEQNEMRRNMIGLAREVADAAGGFLGLTSRISAAERKVIAEIEAVLA